MLFNWLFILLLPESCTIYSCYFMPVQCSFRKRTFSLVFLTIIVFSIYQPEGTSYNPYLIDSSFIFPDLLDSALMYIYISCIIFHMTLMIYPYIRRFHNPHPVDHLTIYTYTNTLRFSSLQHFRLYLSQLFFLLSHQNNKHHN